MTRTSSQLGDRILRIFIRINIRIMFYIDLLRYTILTNVMYAVLSLCVS